MCCLFKKQIYTNTVLSCLILLKEQAKARIYEVLRPQTATYIEGQVTPQSADESLAHLYSSLRQQYRSLLYLPMEHEESGIANYLRGMLSRLQLYLRRNLSSV